ncbi:MAG: metallophosphoesterase [Methanosarcinales archaeon]|nr:metallophosphoesterase [Methanosarcinales archaeon]
MRSAGVRDAGMSIAHLIISDVHADVRALNAILAITSDPKFIAMYGEVRQVINLGDTIGRGNHPVETIERLLELTDEKKLVSIMGNHDEAFLSDQEIFGSSSESTGAHLELWENKRSLRFLKRLPQYWIDEKNRVLAVHGGPIDPETIPDSEKEIPDERAYMRMWQRISEAGYDFVADSGYYYTPELAFDYVEETFGRGFLILCGHEHHEACYSSVGGETKYILDDMIMRKEVFSGRVVRVRSLMRHEGVSYIARVGIAGPAGYAGLGWKTSHFGLLWESKGIDWVGLFRFEL